MKTVSAREWALLAVILIYSFVPTFGGFLRIVELGGGPAILPENPRASVFPLVVVLHISSSFMFCSVGALQFLPGLRRRYTAWHRAAGRIIAAAGCMSAATGLWMTCFLSFPDELQGHLLFWTRIVLSLWMVGLIARAVFAIRGRNVSGHGAAMIRAYAIAQGASTQAVLGIGWLAATGTEPLGGLRDGMMVLAWGLNMLVAERVIARMVTRRNPPRIGIST